jgi:hypothetical protein
VAIVVEQKEHAVLGPSGWDRWGTCAGSVVLTEGLPNVSSNYAKEGTAAHQLLEDCLVGEFDAEELLGREYEVEGSVYAVDMDMADAVNTAIAWVKEELGEDGVLMVEQQVPIAHLTGEKDASGLCDVMIVRDAGKTLVVMDYKHGQGVQVYATDKEGVMNGQLAMYGLGALFMMSPVYDQIEQVKLVVMQPRLEWHDEIMVSIEDLQAFAETVSIAAGRVELNRHANMNGEQVELVVSDKGCKFCNAKHFCPELKNVMTNALAVTTGAEDFDDLTLPKKAASVIVDTGVTPEQLAEVMRAAPLVEDYIKAVRAEVERRLLNDEEVPGFYLGEGRKGARQWCDDRLAAIELTKSGRLKADEAYERKVLSPTKAEKVLKDRPKIWSRIAPLIIQPPGKPSVCKIGDKNPVAKLVAAPTDFEDLTVTATVDAEVDPLS